MLFRVSSSSRYVKIELVLTQLFDCLRAENPSALRKVLAVEGDCLQDGLGISPLDRQMLAEHVSVVIHSAASVRFDDPIKAAVKLNLRSAVDVVQLAGEMTKLKVRPFPALLGPEHIRIKK